MEALINVILTIHMEFSDINLLPFLALSLLFFFPLSSPLCLHFPSVCAPVLLSPSLGAVTSSFQSNVLPIAVAEGFEGTLPQRLGFSKSAPDSTAIATAT